MTDLKSLEYRALSSYRSLTILTSSMTSPSRNFTNFSSSCISECLPSSIIFWSFSSPSVVLPSSFIMFMSFDAASTSLRGPYRCGSSTQPLALVMRNASSLKCSSLIMSSVFFVMHHLLEGPPPRRLGPLIRVPETDHKNRIYVGGNTQQFLNGHFIE